MSSCIAAVASATTLHAQDLSTDDSAQTQSEGSGLEEVVVTAQRRDENLQKTPVSVAALSADVLIDRAVTTEADLPQLAPGLSVRASQSSNQLNYALRGQSLDAFSATRPGVLPYLNEIQVGGGGGSSAFYDLQSIQVLKGPQGTLFGRNATGGAVLFTTAKPVNEFSGYTLARVGNYDLAQVEGAINVPVIDDTLLVRLSGFYQERDGYQKDLFKNERAGDVDRYGGRASVTLKPTDRITNDLVVDYLHADGNSLVGGLYSLNPTGLVPIIALTNFGNAAQFDAIISGFVAGAGGPPNAGQGAAAAYAAANPTLDPGGVASYLQTQRRRGPYEVESDGPNEYRARNTIVSNITSFDVADNATIRNIAGYTNIEGDLYGDIDGVPYGIDDNGATGNIQHTRQYSEELQLQGEAFDDRLKYVVGGYYSYERNFNLTTSNLLTFPIIASVQLNTSEIHNKTFAGYSQGTYDLSELTGIDGLGITAGARYTSEKISINMLPDDISFDDPPAVRARYDFAQSKTFENVSWTFGIQEQFNPNVLVYLASRRSYRNGGYNNVVRPVPGLGTAGGNGYDTEQVTDVELGTKLDGRLAGMPARLNVALFHNWIEDAQRVAYTLVGGSPAAVTVNVPKARVQGVELDGLIEPTTWLQLGAAVTYTDAEFTDNLVSVSGGTPVEFGTYPDTAEWSGSAFGQVTVPVSAAMELTFRTDVYAQESLWFTSTGNLNPNTELPGFGLVSFRIGLQDEAAGWSVSANLKNAFDKVYWVGGVALGELFQTNTAVPGEPRTFLLETRYRF